MSDLDASLKRIKLLLMDVDGTLTREGEAAGLDPVLEMLA